MKKVFFLFLILLLFTSCYATDNAWQKTQEINLETASDPYKWDFGRVKEGEVLLHEFTFKNNYEVKINIEDVTTSCGCTVSEVKNRSLAPGEETIISVKFNTKGYSGATKQYVYVHTDTDNRSVIRFTVEADIVK